MPSFDMEQIEKDYRLGNKSVRMIAKDHGVKSHGTIVKWAKKYGWSRDKSDEVRQRTNAALISGTTFGTPERTNKPTPGEIEKAVRSNVAVIRGHRKDIAKCRRLIDILQAQLVEAAENRAQIEATILAETEGTGGSKTDTRRRAMMMKAVSLPAHAATLRDLSRVIKNLVPLERQAFNIDAGFMDHDFVNMLLKSLPADMSNAVKAKIREKIKK